MKNTNYLKEELYELIKTNESIFDFIQESSLDGLWYWDLEQPEEEWMNPKFWSVLGYDYREMPHKASAWKDIIYPEDLKLATENFIKHCENPEHPYDQTVRYTHKNGSTVWIRCRGLAIRDKHDKPIRMLGAQQDITETKNKELLLQMKTDQLRNAQKVSKIGSWELDLKTNEVVWTEELYYMYGFDSALPPPLYTEQMKLFTPESWQILTSSITITKEQGIPYELELTTIRKDGSHGWMWVRGEAVFDENENIIALRGVAQDISEKKSLELEKEALIKRLNYALDASGDGIWDWKPANGITVFSKAWIEMLGYEVGELASLASEWSDRLHPDDIEWVFAAINKVTQTPENGDTFSHEYRFKNKAGDYLWILNRAKVVERNEQGEAIRVVGTHTNITEKIKSDRALKDSELRLSLATKAAGIGVWDWDIVKNILTWDEQMFALYGVKREQFSNAYEALRKCIYESDREWTQIEVELAIKGEKEFNTEFRVQHANGDIRNIRAIATVVRDQEGNPLRMIGTNWDITKEKEDLKQVEEAKKQAEAANNAKSQFLANMSHEIRTPMNGVLGMLDLVKRTPLNHQQKDYIHKADSAARSLLGILNDILDFSKISANKMVLDPIAFEIEKLLAELGVILAGNLNNKPVEVVFDCDWKLPEFVIADRLRLLQVLINLAGNALKFTERGHVIIRLSLLAKSSDDIEMRVEVEDTGIGISEQQQAQLFQSFEQAEASTTRRYGGTGLGLVISKRLLELMGSELQVESKPNMGSRFWFDLTLPYSAKTFGNSSETVETISHNKVLVVDDSPLMADLLQEGLAKKGWRVVKVNSAIAALDAIATSDQSDDPFDVVLMDWNMPNMNGFEACQKIRSAETHTTLPHIIMITAHEKALISEAEHARQQLFDAVIVKPVTITKVHEHLLACVIDEPPISTVQDTESSAVHAPLTGVKILLVEDNELNQQIASELLTLAGASVSVASCGLEGVAKVVNQHDFFDVVLMDIQMPDIDGIEATKRIRNHGSFTNLPIIAMTANASESDRLACLAAGMNDHIGKPFDMHRLVPLIRRYTGLASADEVVDQSLEHQQQEPQLEDSELIEPIATILARFSDNRELAARMRDRFGKEMSGLMEKMDAAIQTQHQLELTSVFHSIKGVAATLGAVRLAKVVGDLEAQGRQGIWVTAEVISSFRGLVDQSILALEQLRFDAESVQEDITLTPEQLRSLLDQLDAFLAEDNLSAMTLTEKLVTAYKSNGGVNIFYEQVESLDFSSAQHTLQTLKEVLLDANSNDNP